MDEYVAEVIWARNGQDFISNNYSRKHILRFDGGIDVPGSSSPHVVPTPLSELAAVDPEEAFIASLSSCHMLWFLSIAAKRKLCVERYTDKAVGVMAKNPQGKLAITLITLKPEVQFTGEKIPTIEQIHEMHHQAHNECFIANSVRTEIRCEPVYVAA
jgi:organic hydroperoxide reductase OsmC/OhrA